MAHKKRFRWIRHYGTVTVIAIGLVGALFFWAVTTQVEAQTSNLRADNAVFKVRLETIQSDVKTNTETLRKVIENQQAILAALKKVEKTEKKDGSSDP